MPKLIMQRVEGGLRPVDEEGWQYVMRLEPGDQVMVEFRRPRSIQHHKLYWKMIATIQQHVTDLSTDDLHNLIKVGAGYGRIVESKSMGRVALPKASIAFESMDQDEFNEFWERAIRFVLEQVVPGLKRDELEREITELVA